MTAPVDVLAPVRPGDVFRYDESRFATVMQTIPGGRATIRISGERNGKPSLSVGDIQIRSLKKMERMGRAEFRDGCYMQLDHAALARCGGAA